MSTHKYRFAMQASTDIYGELLKGFVMQRRQARRKARQKACADTMGLSPSEFIWRHDAV
jgi:hypothetical protein